MADPSVDPLWQATAEVIPEATLIHQSSLCLCCMTVLRAIAGHDEQDSAVSYETSMITSILTVPLLHGCAASHWWT
eukprot:1152935-Pelagomonas_calceolata.AAC.4